MGSKRKSSNKGLNRRGLLLLGLAGSSALVFGKQSNAMAQEGGRETSRTSVTRLVENDRVGVARMVSRPRDKGAMNERPDRVLYIERGAKVRFHYPDGKTEDALLKTGDVVYQKADTRQVENIDTNDLVYISVHLK